MLYIFDIDGTLANCANRLHHIRGPKKDYDAFYKGMIHDEPIEATIEVCQALMREDDNIVLFVSGRPDNYRKETVAWLEEYVWCGGEGYIDSILYMRKAGDYRKDCIVKKEILDEIRKKYGNPDAAFDDRQQVVDMWRANGVRCYQVDQWSEHEKPTSRKVMREDEISLVLMVGPVAAGKSTWLRNTTDVRCVISSDNVRAELGVGHDFEGNAATWGAVHDALEARLKNGLFTVIDGTNIHKKDRRVMVEMARKYQPKAGVVYIVVDRPLEDKLRDRDWRSEELVKTYHQRFQSAKKDALAGDGYPFVSVVPRIDW